MSTDQLLDFRTAWLRAVAHAWMDMKGFGKELMEHPTEAITKVDGAWLWEKDIELRVEKAPQLQWIGDNWVWPKDLNKEEHLTLYVPLRPNIEPEYHAAALADYYTARPSLFGNGASPDVVSSLFDPSIFNSWNSVLAEQIDAPLLGSRIASREPPHGGFVPNQVSFLDFGVALLSIMAKAWENENFAALIVQDENVVEALSTVRGYRPPWKLNLAIRDDEQARWHEKAVLAHRWEPLRPHELVLHLPEPPQEPREQSIALAAYNATGAEFPFTCCP